MSGWRFVLFLCLGALVAAGGTLLAVRGEALLPETPRTAAIVSPPRPPPIDAAQIASGRIAMERMPDEVGTALEVFSDEIVKNAQALERKQARISGTCAPGSAIRIIGEDGSVRCQQLPRGVISLSAATAIPRLSSTTTEAANIHGGAGRYQSGGEDDYLVAPVTLPDGAIVTSFSYTYFDAATDADTEAYLYRSDDQPLALVASEGADERVRTGSTDKVVLRTVDAARYAYFVYFKISTRAGARLMPISASISYRLP
jgi:hypothetical protein